MEINKPISTIVIFIVSALLLYFFVVPQYQAISDSETTLAQKQAEYNGKSMYYKKIAEIISAIESKQDSLQKVKSALPSDPSLSSLTYFLQKKAAENGMVLKLVSFSKNNSSGDGTTLGTINTSLNMLGTYENFKSFIASLDSTSRLFNVNTMAFSSGGSGPVSVAPAKGTAGPAQPTSQQPTYGFSMEIQTHTY